MPLPWAGTEPRFGFSPGDATAAPWLPQPKEWRELTVAAESGHADSMLTLYRAALRLRRTEAAFGSAPLVWRPAPDGVIAFDRPGPGTVTCLANLSGDPAGLPPHTAVLLASGPLDGGLLPPDTAVWLRR